MTKYINPSHVWDTYTGELEIMSGDLSETISLKAPASYIIFKDGDVVKAKNGETGVVEFSGTDAATVIQQTIDALTNEGKIFIKRGTYIINQKIECNNTVGIEIEGEGKDQGWITGSSEIGSQGKGTILYGNDIDRIIELNNAHNIIIRNLSLEGKANIGIYMNAGGGNQIDVSIIGKGIEGADGIQTAIYTEGLSGLWNKVSGSIYGVPQGIYANMDKLMIKRMCIAYPFVYGIRKGTGIVHVVLIACDVVDERTSEPYVSGIAYWIEEARHILLIGCRSELYNPEAYHIKYSTYSPTTTYDIVPVYDHLFLGSAKIDWHRIVYYEKGVPRYPINYGGVRLQNQDGSKVGLVLYTDENEHVYVKNPFKSDYNKLIISRWSTLSHQAPFSFNGGIEVGRGGTTIFKVDNAGRLYLRQKGVSVAVSEGSTSINITLPVSEEDTNYGVLVTPYWNTSVWITNKTTSGFTVNFGTAAPTGGSYIDWFVYR